MQKFIYTIKDPNGLHARPAGLLVRCTQACSSDIKLGLNSKFADAKRLFSVMGLGVKCGDQVTVDVEGPNEESEAAQLEEFFQKNL